MPRWQDSRSVDALQTVALAFDFEILCGTGWSRQESVKLRDLVEELETTSPAVNLKRKGAVLTEPFLVAEVEYRAWTDEGKLRHPSFKGIRERADDVGVFELI